MNFVDFCSLIEAHPEVIVVVNYKLWNLCYEAYVKYPPGTNRIPGNLAHIPLLTSKQFIIKLANDVWKGNCSLKEIKANYKIWEISELRKAITVTLKWKNFK